MIHVSCPLKTEEQWLINFRRSGKVTTRVVTILVTIARPAPRVAQSGDDVGEDAGRRHDVVTLLETGGDVSLFTPFFAPLFRKPALTN